MKSAEVAVIGGGAVGSSIAYRLAEAGVEVILLEKGSVCSGTSGATFAWVGAHGQRPFSYYQLRKTSLDLFPDISRCLGFDVEYRPQGSLILLEDEAEFRAAQREVSELKEEGNQIDLLKPTELYALEPGLRPGFQGATYCPLGGSLNPFRLVCGYQRRARELGACIPGNAEVQEIRVRDGRVHSVITDSEDIRVDRVVNAAGVHAPHIGRMVGLEVPVRPVRGQILVSEPLPPVISHILDDVRQSPSGNLLVGRLDEEAGYRNVCTPEGIGALASRARKIMPLTEKVHFIRAYSGLRPMPADELPILGETREVKGFFNSVMHSGITLSAVVGVLMAQLIKEGEAEIPLESYSPRRFQH